MRLHELKKPKEIDLLRNYKQNTVVDPRSLKTWAGYARELLEPHDFEAIGAGAFGTVYMHPTYPFALKVFRKDSGFTRWFKFAKQNQSNPFVPKLKGQIVTILKGEIYASRMEKLEQIPNNKHGWPDPDYLNEASQVFLKYYNHFKAEYKNNPPVTGNEDMDSIFQIFSRNKGRLDLGWMNIMKRGDQLVVIDPFYGWN